MNMHAFKEAFLQSRHTPAIRTLRGIMGKEREIVDFCVPVNIGFPPPTFLESLKEELAERLKYYPSEPRGIAEKFAAFLSLPAGSVLAGNGSTELFYDFLSYLGPGRRILTCVPTFGRWTDAPRASGHFVVGYERREERAFALDSEELLALAKEQRVDTVLLSNPNNPTGQLTGRAELLRLIGRLRSEVPSLEYVVVDESFLDFSALAAETTLLGLVTELEGVIVLKSLGKSLGLHGTRMGVLVAPPALARAIEAHIPYWSVNGVAEAVIDLMPRFRQEFAAGLANTIAATSAMRARLGRVKGFTAFDTEANYVYIKAGPEVNPIRLRDRLLLRHDLLLRSCGNKVGSDARHFRIATRPPQEVSRLVRALEEEI